MHVKGRNLSLLVGDTHVADFHEANITVEVNLVPYY